jgi:O-glycosyl hydrolase
MKNIISLVGILFASASAYAISLEPFIQYNPSPGERTDFDGIVGVDFVAASAVEITHLGFYDAGGDGLKEAHEVGLMETSSGEVIALVTIPAGVGAFYSNFCRWVELDQPVVLTPGTSYTVAANVFVGGDPWLNSGGQNYPPTRFSSTISTWTTDFTISRWQGGTSTVGVPANLLGNPHRNRGYFAGNIAAILEPEVDYVSVDLDVRHQTIRSFGASDAWNTDFVGRYFNEQEKEYAAQLLFSQELDEEGNPLGIGLTRWRYYIGSGSALQGTASGIENHHRRTEGFLTLDGNYNWDRQLGQNWFLQRAKDYGVEEFVAFAVSPPVNYTMNGLSYPNEGHGRVSNLRPDRYTDFANYLADVAVHFRDVKGIDFGYISPVNEPQYDWSEGRQDGSPWSNTEIAKLVREMNSAFQSKGVGSKIFIAEAGQLDHLTKTSTANNASDALNAFFNPSRDTYVGNLENIFPGLNYHSYWTAETSSRLRGTRTEARDIAASLGIELAQTEYSLLEIETVTEGRPSGYMDIAVYQAKILHADLKYADVTSWSYWTAMEQERYNQKNRFELLWLNAGTEGSFDLRTGGSVEPNKTLWAYGNFSRFIRPGYSRLEQTGADDLLGLMGTAWISPENDRIVNVFVNWHTVDRFVELGFSNQPDGVKVSRMDTYLTDVIHDLSLIGSHDSTDKIHVPPLSIVTVVTEIVEDTEPMESVLDRLNPGWNDTWLSLSDKPVFVVHPFFYNPATQSWHYVPQPMNADDESWILEMGHETSRWYWTSSKASPWVWNAEAEEWRKH